MIQSKQVATGGCLRWLLILVGLCGQLAVLTVALAHAGVAASVDVLLSPVEGRPGVCQVVALRPFSVAWVRGVQPGVQVRIVAGPQRGTCRLPLSVVRLEVVGLPASAFTVDVRSPPVDFFDVAIVLLLAVIFDVTGIAILLRAQHRQTAWVTYALFTGTALILCLLNLRGAGYFWLNLLGFTTAMLVRGLSVTFVCLFHYPFEQKAPRRFTPVRPYIPLLVGVLLALLSACLPVLPLQAGLVFITLNIGYNVLCVLTVIGVMAWGLRHLGRQERQFVRMVVTGLLFLLLPLVLNLMVIRTDAVTVESLVRLIPIPLAVLPIACDYALFRRHLLGTTSMLSRQAMRGLLWLLLASVFLFPSIVVLRTIDELHLSQDGLDYVYALLLVVGLLLFPLLWSKVRDAGDQVFYQDFYEYNRSLRDLSAALTRLQGLEQISAFMLPRLALLLNATEVCLLVRAAPRSSERPGQVSAPAWHVYRQVPPAVGARAGEPGEQLAEARLIRLANLGLTQLSAVSAEPLLLDGLLLLALYDGARCSGFLCLGPKLNQEPYRREDRSFLSTLASQLSVLEVNSRYLEQARANAGQLVALTHRVLSAQEDERRRLALDLHDDVLQQAMLVVRQLSDASNMAEVAEVMPLARSLAASLRRTCLELRPPLLDELGLAEALLWLARQAEERIHIQATCPGNWQTRLPANVELAFYRVAQEALSNVFKYADASMVRLRLRSTRQGVISLLVSDNGPGILKSPPLAENLGLVGMYERMEAIGGTLQMRTGPGRGVTIRALYRPASAGAAASCRGEEAGL
ncbi:MAG TPA: ATP-binding protein [Ktedonobacteraceae bacterium]|jgi:signal transduction histidine kinase